MKPLWIAIASLLLSAATMGPTEPDRSLAGVRYAHQFPGANWCEQVNNAMRDLPATGGTVDLRGYSGVMDGCSTSISFPYPASFGTQPEVPKPVTLQFGPGIYRLGEHSINVVQSGAHLVGAGIQATTIEYSGLGSAIYSALNWPEAHPHHNRYEGFALRYTGSGTAIGMYLVRPIGNEVRSVRISNFAGSGINLDTAGLSYGTLNTVDNVQIDGCSNYGIILQGANVEGGTTAGTRIVNSNVVCDASKGVAVAIRVDAAAATYIAGNYLEGKGNGGVGVWVTTHADGEQVLETRDTVLVGNRLEALEVGVRVEPGQWRPVAGYTGNHTEAVTVERQGF